MVTMSSCTRRQLLTGMLAAPMLASVGRAASDPAAGFTPLLASYLRPGGDGITRVDYAAWKSGGRDALRGVIKAFEAMAPGDLPRAAQFAFWTNLYNAKTIDVILENYPVKSIRDINLGGSLFGSGPWSAEILKVGGNALSLDDIEHKILRKGWKDPRVHYAVNCASISCPNLQIKPFAAKGLGTSLDAAAVQYINHRRGVGVAASGLTVSKIYKWFAEDFGGSGGLPAHWTRYAEPELAATLAQAPRIKAYAYDWSLNDSGA